MSDVIYTSQIKIIQDVPPIRRAFIKPFDDPVTYGIHGAIAAFYKKEPEIEYPATLDHMIGAVGG